MSNDTLCLETSQKEIFVLMNSFRFERKMANYKRHVSLKPGA